MRHFTIILPTRNRADTLYWSLKNCLAQDYERMTVLVSDNCSDDKTREVIASFNDPRLRSVRTQNPTSMAGNVEFALSQVIEEDTHVTGIGDDDGLMPGGLAFADEMLSSHPGVDVLTWTTSNYCWPSCLVDAWRNNLQLSLSSHTQVLSTKEMLAKLADYRVYYHHLPGLWTSLVSAKVLRACKARLGRIIISMNPDAGSAVHVGCMVSSYLFTHKTVTLLGSSSHSTGMSGSTGKKNVIEQFLADTTIKPHPDLDLITNGAYCVTECLLQARDHGLLPSGVTLNLPKALQLMLLRNSVESEEVYSATLRAVKASAARHNIPLDFGAIEKQNEIDRASLFCDPVITAHENIIYHRCDPRLTSNIHEAANLAGELLRAHQAGLLVPPAQLEQVVNDRIYSIKQDFSTREELAKNREETTRYKDGLAKSREKIAKGKEKVKRLEKKLAEALARQERGIFSRVRNKLRALRGRS